MSLQTVRSAKVGVKLRHVTLGSNLDSATRSPFFYCYYANRGRVSAPPGNPMHNASRTSRPRSGRVSDV